MDEIKINSIDELNNLEIKRKEIEIENEWRICCSKSSSVFIKYIVQVIISIIILIFSIVQLSIDDKRDKSIYVSLISTILGLFIPAPRLDKK